MEVSFHEVEPTNQEIVSTYNIYIKIDFGKF